MTNRSKYIIEHVDGHHFRVNGDEVSSDPGMVNPDRPGLSMSSMVWDIIGKIAERDNLDADLGDILIHDNDDGSYLVIFNPTDLDMVAVGWEWEDNQAAAEKVKDIMVGLVEKELEVRKADRQARQAQARLRSAVEAVNKVHPDIYEALWVLEPMTIVSVIDDEGSMDKYVVEFYVDEGFGLKAIHRVTEIAAFLKE